MRRSLGLKKLKHALTILTLNELLNKKDYFEDDLENYIDKTKTILRLTLSLIIIKTDRISLVYSLLKIYFREGENSSQ